MLLIQKVRGVQTVLRISRDIILFPDLAPLIREVVVKIHVDGVHIYRLLKAFQDGSVHNAC